MFFVVSFPKLVPSLATLYGYLISCKTFSWFIPVYSLLVEEIDVGEAKCRQVVSGLAKFCSPEQLTVCFLLLSIHMCLFLASLNCICCIIWELLFLLINLFLLLCMQNRLVVLVTNMKPSKLRDVISEGMVLYPILAMTNFTLAYATEPFALY